MALQVTVRNGGAAGSTTVDITDRLRADVGLQLGNRAYRGESAQSSLVIDDDEGEYGNAEGLPSGTMLSIAAHNVVTVTETATDPDTVLLRGRVSPKEIARGDVEMDRARQVTVRCEDYNWDLAHAAFLTDYERPSESDVTRVTWVFDTFLSGSPRLTTNLTSGIIATGPVTMPAKKYEAGAQPIDVLRDCATAAEKEFFAMADDTFYYGPTNDTSKVAGLRISDRLDEAQTEGGGGVPQVEATLGFGRDSAADENFTVSDKVDSCLYLFLHTEEAGSIIDPAWYPTGITGAREEFTYITEVQPAANTALMVFRLVNPTPGTGVVTHEGVWPRAGGVFHLSGVDQSDPDDTAVSNTGTGTTSSLSGAATATQLFINQASWRADNIDPTAAPTPVAGQTEAYSGFLNSSFGKADFEYGGGYGDATPGWTFNSSQTWGALGLAVNGRVLTFPPIPVGPASTEDGQGLLSGGVLRHADGFVTETRSSVADEYDYCVEAISDTGAVNASDATSRLSAILDVFQYEHRTYQVAIQLHRTQVHLVKAGQQIDIKWRAIPDADDQFRTRRIVNLEWQWVGPEHYLAVMELDKPIRVGASPGAGAAAAAMVAAKKADPDAGHWEQLFTGGSSSEAILTGDGDPIYVFVET